MSEDGIYCELNLPHCITYSVPLGSGHEQLNGLFSSIERQILRLKDDAVTCGESGLVVLRVLF